MFVFFGRLEAPTKEGVMLFAEEEMEAISDDEDLPDLPAEE